MERVLHILTALAMAAALAAATSAAEAGNHARGKQKGGRAPLLLPPAAVAPARPELPLPEAPAQRALPQRAAEGGCFSQRDTQRMVGSGAVLPLSAALDLAGVEGRLVQAALCDDGDGYHYSVTLIEPGDRLRRLAIPAN